MNTEQQVERHLPLTTVAFEILLAVADGGRSGYEVMLAIDERTGGRVNPNPGTLYRAIDRLVGHGLIDCHERGEGKQGRSFELSELGTRVLAAESERLAAQVSAARAAVGSRRGKTA